jgi:DNA replication regulator DPB11
MTVTLQPQSRQGSTDLRPTPPAIPASRLPRIEADDELNIIDGNAEQSARVMYEDPGQREEKDRLMSLLESQGSMDGNGGHRKKSVRKGVRMAGF